jgi:lantibiotic biosynthesis protein
MHLTRGGCAAEVQAWHPILEEALSAQALNVARLVAGRLHDREALLQLNQRAIAQSHYPETLHWHPCALAHGDAGLALACAYFERCWPGEGWHGIASAYLAYAVQAARSIYLPGGLFAGLAGVAFAAMSQRAPLSGDFDQLLAAHAVDMSGRLHGRHGVAVSEFDLISGLAGTGAYFLAAGEPPPTDVAMRALLEAYVALSETIDDIPHWFTPHDMLGDNPMADVMPHGNMNCGLAHGIPGPLGLMALALSAGIDVDGLHEALSRTAAWVAQQRIWDAYGVNWPTVVPLTAQGQPAQGVAGSRAAWCYGAPGVARALWLAGRALGKTALCDLAVEAMAAVYQRPLRLRQIDSPTFCHGVAGLLQITLRFAHDTGLPMFCEAAASLCRQLLSEFCEEHALGYCSIEPEGNRVDQCGLLDGAAGVVMVLLAASTPQVPDWDRIFLLS